MFGFNFGSKGYEVLSGNANKEENPNKGRFNQTMANVHDIGGKKFAYIPLTLLFVDERYQRKDTYRKATVNTLVAKWDPNKMDPLRVSVHRETCNFAVIDGMHRLFAAILRGDEFIVCEIIDLGDNTEERLIKEATLFAYQETEREKLRPMDQHKAHLIRKDKEYVDLDDIVTHMDGVEFKAKDGRGAGKAGQLTGYVQATKICRVHGKEHMKNVLEALVGAGWNETKAGLGSRPLRMVSRVLLAHKETEVKAEVARVLRNYDVNLFLSVARGVYPMTKPGVAATLYLEDLVCTRLNIPRLIDGGDVKRVEPEVA